ncbi:right-handed parallel beta-helix repeat-containing protein [Glycomyces sp. A-F 0318]|uniref:right-handed parallel beta-helix repeat-containing protein n=1 Tax=Glycomyces amatae TaxID=2881355 RepID=UPI001E4B4B39|nr:right-handed parallel beta-helix repeat-containing protein [Glycomyces amatae]MCD0443416.1 right-handed parallel beta-helix repeat-containing protein [Glycomyces amatae]
MTTDRSLTATRAARGRAPRRWGRKAALAFAALTAAAAAAAVLGAAPASAQTATITVATGGDDANPGTVAAPLETIQAAVDRAVPGTVIQIRGGTYAPSTNVQINSDGTAAAPITMRPYGSEKVVIDGENMPHTPGAVDSSIPRADRGALHVEGDHWRFERLEIIHGPYAIFALDSNHNVYDRLVTRDNYESGLHIQGASSNNRIVNLDSYNNVDPRKNGESADGLAIKEGSGTGNTVIGARLWSNADDGFDAWEFLSPIRIEDSVAYGNGYNHWDLPDYSGDGNGFKMGGGDEDLPAAHVVVNSMAWKNSAHGFTDNGNPGSLQISRSTAWKNTKTGFDFDSSASQLTANLAVGNAAPAALGDSTGSGNSWDVESSWKDADLKSTSTSAITGARTCDGSIPFTTFLVPENYPNLGATFA